MITTVGMYLLWSKMSTMWVKLHVAALIHCVSLRMDGQYGLLEVETMVGIIIAIILLQCILLHVVVKFPVISNRSTKGRICILKKSKYTFRCSHKISFLIHLTLG